MSLCIAVSQDKSRNMSDNDNRAIHVPKDIWHIITKMSYSDEISVLQLTRSNVVTEIGYFRDISECYRIAAQMIGNALLCNGVQTEQETKDMFKLLFQMDPITKIGDYVFTYPTTPKGLYDVLVGYIRRRGSTPVVNVTIKKVL